jgi:catechol O-methyltransferase
MLPPDGHLTSVELSSTNAAIARQMVEYAGLSDKVTIVEGTVSTVLKDYVQRNSLPPFDFVFIDHAKEYYLSDFRYLLNEKLIAKNGIIVADNILFPGAPDYREYVNTHPETLKSVEYLRKLEYSHMEDIIMVSELLV